MDNETTAVTTPVEDHFADWVNAIPFTREHEKQIAEIHKMLSDFGRALESVMPMAMQLAPALGIKVGE